MTRIIKRLIDLTSASFVLFLFAPVMALVALAIRMILGRPVFFRQIRPGYRAKPFTLYKFRTMREAYNDVGTLRPDAAAMMGALLDMRRIDVPTTQPLLLGLGAAVKVALLTIGPRFRALVLTCGGRLASTARIDSVHLAQ